MFGAGVREFFDVVALYDLSEVIVRFFLKRSSGRLKWEGDGEWGEGKGNGAKEKGGEGGDVTHNFDRYRLLCARWLLLIPFFALEMKMGRRRQLFECEASK